MPIFEYKCEKCQKEFERVVFAGDTGKVECPECKGFDVKKKMSVASFMGSSIGTCASSGPKQFS
jgi:putative FmdB family regulatory protein